MNTRFIIFTTQRSGSTVLTRSLDEHPEIFCAGEIFQTSNDIHHPEWHFSSWGMESKNHSIQKINKIVNYPNLRFLSVPHIKKFYAANAKGEKARGFKLMFTHIKTAPHLWDYLKENNVKVIVLIRKNVFQTALSRYRKAENRVAHIQEATAVSAIEFSVPGEQLIKQMHDLERVNANLLSYTNNMNRLVLHYEDLFEWDDMMNKVQSFLKVDHVEIKPVLKKVGVTAWEDEVKNADEIKQLLQKNNFTQYIEQ